MNKGLEMLTTVLLTLAVALVGVIHRLGKRGETPRAKLIGWVEVVSFTGGFLTGGLTGELLWPGLVHPIMIGGGTGAFVGMLVGYTLVDWFWRHYRSSLLKDEDVQ